MKELERPGASTAQAQREALDWILLLTSGAATEADQAALEHWRTQSRDHQRAFAETNRIWDVLGPAAARLRARQQTAGNPGKRSSAPALHRRALIGGSLAAAAATAACLVSPPLALWPSLAEFASDHRTGIGERRRIDLADQASVQLNTRTSISLRRASGRDEEIELVAGEAAVETGERTLTVLAGGGRAVASGARFNIRCDSGAVRVACIAGEVDVGRGHQTAKLSAGRQVAYDANGVGPVTTVEPETVTAWQQGMLVFRQMPLAAVIEEINRYRPGRIVLMNGAMGRLPVVATFRIDRLDDVAERLAKVFGAKLRALPGGIVLLS